MRGHSCTDLGVEGDYLLYREQQSGKIRMTKLDFMVIYETETSDGIVVQRNDSLWFEINDINPYMFRLSDLVCR